MLMFMHLIIAFSKKKNEKYKEFLTELFKNKFCEGEEEEEAEFNIWKGNLMNFLEEKSKYREDLESFKLIFEKSLCK